MLPTEFLARLRLAFPPERVETILQGLSGHKPTTFRVNTLKSTNEAVLAELTADGWELEPVTWNTHAFIVRKHGASRIATLPVFTEGKLYLQSLSSMLPALVLDPKEGESVLDVAAAPGSKTTQLAALMKNTGNILANDISPIRLEKLKANLRIQGVTNVTISQTPAQALPEKFANQFDNVLVDVPCTMEGRFDATNPKSYKNWSEFYANEFPQRQLDILRAAITCAKPGGTIVYSTCTISPDENEKVIERILQAEKNISQEQIDIPNFTFTTPGRVDPTADYEGFFVAKLRKLA
jgi:NOL1/NOP2/sun family putative RNA methylase